MSQSTRDGTGNYGRTERLTESERYELLASERRRIALAVLESSAGPIEVETLAATLATWENGASGETVERAASSLHHVHLPKMDDLGVIEYDPVAARVESRP